MITQLNDTMSSCDQKWEKEILPVGWMEYTGWTFDSILDNLTTGFGEFSQS